MYQSKSITLIGDPGIGDMGGWARDESGNAYYTVQSGDTINKLALTYLGSTSRSMELFDMQSWANDSRHQGDPNRIFIGDRMVFPPDGEQAAIDLGFLDVAPTTTLPQTPVFTAIPQILDGSILSQATPFLQQAGAMLSSGGMNLGLPGAAPTPTPAQTAATTDTSSNGVVDMGEADQWQLTPAEQASKAKTEQSIAWQQNKKYVYGAAAGLALLGVAAVVHARRAKMTPGASSAPQAARRRPTRALRPAHG